MAHQLISGKVDGFFDFFMQNWDVIIASHAHYLYQHRGGRWGGGLLARLPLLKFSTLSNEGICHLLESLSPWSPAGIRLLLG